MEYAREERNRKKDDGKEIRSGRNGKRKDERKESYEKLKRERERERERVKKK